MAKISKSGIETRKLSQLKPFPTQAAFFHDLPDAELQALADDIRANGLKYPIEIMPPKNAAGLPANTVIAGHQRARAVKLNGNRDVHVSVRYDLAAASRGEVDEVFLKENVLRRQMDPLDRAKVMLHLCEIERKRQRVAVQAGEDAESRDRVAKIAGMTGRNLSRYWQALKAPSEVQVAFRAKELTLNLAARVGDLPKRERDEIARRIAAGEPPRQVVASYVGTSRSAPTSASASSRLAKHLAGIIGLESELCKLPASALKEQARAIWQANELLRKLFREACGGFQETTEFPEDD